jgi:hypothetical protein
MAAKPLAEGDQVLAREQPSVRIVGMTHEGEVGIAGIRKFASLNDSLTGKARGAGEFAVGLAKNRRASRRHEAGDERQQNLCAGRRHDASGGRGAIKTGGGFAEFRDRTGLRQASDARHREPRQRMRMGIDPGRQVDERFGCAGEKGAGSGEVAAMGVRFPLIAKGRDVACAHSEACRSGHAD